MKILIIAPHGDDEVLGCGGTIARYSNEGQEINLCIVSKPHQPKWSIDYINNRENEILKSCKTLGISSSISLGLPTTDLTKYIDYSTLIDKISEVIKDIKPDILYIPYNGDLHQDHIKISECSLVASRPDRCDIKKVFMYETLSETEWGLYGFTPNVYVDISKFIKKKLQAMECYSSELKEHPHPRSISGITALARKRGSEINTSYAEGFKLIREII